MAMPTIDLLTSYSTVTCCHDSCGMTFAVPDSWETNRRRNHTWWYCPNGHKQHWSGESDLEKYQRLFHREQSRHDQTQAELRETEARRRGEKAAKTRIKNRISKGICIHCNRSFEDLRRHMETKHKEVKNDRTTSTTNA